MKILKKITHKLKSTPKKVWLSLAMTFLIIIPAAVLLTKNKADAAWWNDSWQYRKAINVSNTSGSDLTDFQVQILLNRDLSADITAGKIKSDLSDLRITDLNGKLIPYWIEDTTAASVDVWVKMATVPTSGATVFMYYGNPNATSLSSGNKVFEFFDDFSSDTSSSYQSSGGSFTISGGFMNVTGVSIANTIIAPKIQNPSASYVVETRASENIISAGVSDSWVGILGFQISIGSINTGYCAEAGNYASGGQGMSMEYFTAAHLATAVVSYPDSSYHLIKGSFSPSNLKTTFDRTTTVSSTHNLYTSGYYGLRTYNANASYDWWFLRKFATVDPTAAAPASEEKTVAPLVYWKFDEGQGTVANDSTGNLFSGTLSGVTWKTEDQCISGKCLYFDGVSNSVYGGSFASSPNAETNEVWIRPESNGTIIAECNNSACNNYVYTKLGINADKSLIVHFWNMAGTLNLGQVEFGKWYHVAITYNGTTLTGYLNGVAKGSKSDNRTPPGVQYLHLGRGNGQCNGGFDSCSVYMKGFMDEFKVYSYARSASQIAMDYNAGLAGTGSSDGAGNSFGGGSPKWMSDGLVGHWKMDEASWNGTAGEVKDSSGVGNNGTSSVAATASVGKFGNGGLFNGTTNKVVVPDVDNLSFTNNVFTVSFWYKTTDFGGSKTVISKKGTTASNFEYAIMANSGVLFYFFDLAGNGVYLAPPVTIDAGWNLYTATADGNNMYVYKNGVLQNTVAKSAYSLGNSTGALNIGQGGGFNQEYYLNGNLDEVRMYNKFMSPQEVSKLYEYAPGPVGYWKLDENQGGTGAITADFSGNGNNGTLFDRGLPDGPIWDSGKFGSALKFDGSQSVDTAADPSALQTTTGTVCAWINPSDLASGFDSFQGIFSYENDYISGNYGYAYGLREGGFAFLIGDNSGYYEEFGIDGIVENKWTHTCMTFSPTNVTLYKNSRSIGSWTPTKTAQFLPGTIARIGSYDTVNNYNFRGKIDEVKVYNYIRTQKQIAEDMGGTGPAKNEMLGYWKMDGNSKDSSGNGYDGTDTSVTYSSSNAKFGQAGVFAGAGNIDMGNVLDIGTSPVSVSAWIKTSTTGVYQFIAGKSISGSTSSWEVRVNSFNNIELNFFDFNATPGIDQVVGTTNVCDGNWHHIVAERDGKNLTVYVDGKLDGSVTDNAVDVTSIHNFRIGRDNVGNFPFNGSIDEVKVFNYGLSVDEIKNEFNQGASVKMSGSGTTTAGGNIDSKSAEYCVPGDSTSCSAPIGEWSFDEKQGTTVKDISGNGRDGTFNGTGNHWTQGKVGAAGNFDFATADYVSTTHPLTGNSELTLSAWINDSYTGSRQEIAAGGSATSSDGFMIYIDTNGKFNFDFPNSKGPTGTINVADGKWHYVSAVRRGTLGMEIYVDGKLDGISNAPLNTLTNTFYIGRAAYNNSNYVKGQIDQVRLYNYARTPAQIAYDYNRGGPVAQYRMDECQGNTIFDATGNGNNGTLIIGATGSQTSIGTCTAAGTAWGNGASGKFGSSVNFDGTDDGVSLSANGDQFYDKTISAWIYTSVNNAYQEIYSRYRWVDGFNYDAEEFRLTNTGKLQYAIANNLANSYITSVSNVPINKWVHVSVTRDGNNAKLYIDNILDISSASFSTRRDVTWLNRSIGVSYPSAPSYWFNGRIDDVRIYNYALTPAQIANVINEGGALRFGPATGSVP
jgi:hypothetical protein